ncbi:MGMT family protein [Metabacillus sp. 113a]|uniref:MGMT family protein n=1 Tax=Metabacillus sp. 113a TaxID=3404706 RepID=UPI003CFB02B3
MEPFTEKVIGIIKSIPAGKVMTYGQIAYAAGSPRGARQVVRILHSMSKKYNLPWHRVVNYRGELSIKDKETLQHQKTALVIEGIRISRNNIISLKDYQHQTFT